jgi:hypothetical protein
LALPTYKILLSPPSLLSLVPNHESITSIYKMAQDAPPPYTVYPRPVIDLGKGYTAPPKYDGGKALTAAECGIFGPELQRGGDRPVTEEMIARQRARVSKEVLDRIMRMIFFLNMNITHAQIIEWVVGYLDAANYQWDVLTARAKALISELQRGMFTTPAFRDFVSFLQATSRE